VLLLWAENFYTTWRLRGTVKIFLVICVIRIFTIKIDKIQCAREHFSYCAAAHPRSLEGTLSITMHWATRRDTTTKKKTHTRASKRMTGLCALVVISGFRRDADEICALLWCYAESSGNPLPTFRDNVSVTYSWTASHLKIRLISCPETSVKDYHSMLSNTPEEHRDYMYFLVLYHTSMLRDIIKLNR
jgi:hypothetical protein